MSDQLPLFAVPEPPKPIRLGVNQRAVLERVKRYGNVRVREAGRIVYIRRGWHDPSRVGPDWLDRAGLRVLISLKRVGLVAYSRRQRRWVLTAAGRTNDLIGPERSEGPPLARSEHHGLNRGTLRARLGHPCKTGENSLSDASISAAGDGVLGAVGRRL